MMIDEKSPQPPAEPAPAVEGPADPRPQYEPPCLVKKRAVTRATLFSGGGGPSSAPLVTTG
jgi:hypothetical protein